MPGREKTESTAVVRAAPVVETGVVAVRRCRWSAEDEGPDPRAFPPESPRSCLWSNVVASPTLKLLICMLLATGRTSRAACAAVSMVGILVMVLLSGCAGSAGPAAPTSSSPTTPLVPPTRTADPTASSQHRSKVSTPIGSGPQRGTALAAIAALTVKGRAPKTGYSRERFGPAWSDTDGNGCDQRDDVLRRDLTHKTYDGCEVLSGRLRDPYTGRVIGFHRGLRSSAAVQIDHVVALSDAWQTGAQKWRPAKRLRFANDTLNLLAVDGPTNESKGDGDTATWLPPRKSFRCSYVAHQVAVKKTYGLWVTSAERSAMRRVLTGCPSMKLPVRARIPSPPTEHRPTAPQGRRSTAPRRVVHPGAFCSAVGATGVTSKGTPMVCSTKPGDDRARWRSR